MYEILLNPVKFVNSDQISVLFPTPYNFDRNFCRLPGFWWAFRTRSVYLIKFAKAGFFLQKKVFFFVIFLIPFSALFSSFQLRMTGYEWHGYECRAMKSVMTTHTLAGHDTICSVNDCLCVCAVLVCMDLGDRLCMSVCVFYFLLTGVFFFKKLYILT